jgi:hypothetical protein
VRCGYCGHVHVRVDPATFSYLGGAWVYEPCGCGCVEEGWRYENGPTILDAPMQAAGQ